MGEWNKVYNSFSEFLNPPKFYKLRFWMNLAQILALKPDLNWEETIHSFHFHQLTWVFICFGVCHVALVVKNPPANAEDIRNVGLIPGNPLQYSCLENPWIEKSGALQSIGLQRVRHNWSNLASTHSCFSTEIMHLVMAQSLLGSELLEDKTELFFIFPFSVSGYSAYFRMWDH